MSQRARSSSHIASRAFTAPAAAIPSGGKRCLLLLDNADWIALQALRTLSAQSFIVTYAEDREAAWEFLASGTQDFDAIIVDRDLSWIDGIDLLKKIRAIPHLTEVPVVMVTTGGDADAIRQALELGTCYFITKPLEPELLASIAAAAVGQYRRYREQLKNVQGAERSLALIEKGVFRFRSLDDARTLASALSRACPNPEKSVIGIEELLINAVEHGNLGISYQEKTQLLKSGTWMEEVRNRLASPIGCQRSVTVTFERLPDESVRIEIKDDGEGFDWRQYVGFDVERTLDSHGRGIALAKALSFDSLQYLGNGNTVVATIQPKRL